MNTSATPPLSGIGYEIWDAKYRHRIDGQAGDADIADTWRRVADALAEVEAPADRAHWSRRFYEILDGLAFLPGGRILAGAGTGRRTTLFNCFVMGVIEDSTEGIFTALREAAVTMQQGGGIGCDFSTLRPRGAAARGSGATASGPVSFMRVWDTMCGTILSTGSRRGAMMATLRCDHPDLLEFIEAKATPGALTHFNLSVQITDDFLQAVADDRTWELVFPCKALGEPPGTGETVQRRRPGLPGLVPCRVFARHPARELWSRIVRAAYEYAEPGVLFIDRIQRMNNLHDREEITATNPCGEVPLPPYGACDLGSVNLTRFIARPFTADAAIQWGELRKTVTVAVRLLDNVIDVSPYPLEAQERRAHATRRIGLGVTGLADALAMLGLHYDSAAARTAAGAIMETICVAAYRASAALAREKGPFPRFDPERYTAAPFIRRLPDDLRAAIAAGGIRNSHLLAIAPTGTISLLAGNISSGIEPIYRLEHQRRMRIGGGDDSCTRRLRDYAYGLWRRTRPDQPVPDHFVDAHHLPPEAHLEMQAAVQAWVDQAVSKTINVPEGYPFEEFAAIYDRAAALGLKGCTAYRPNPVTGAILTGAPAEYVPPGPVHCACPDREPD